MEAGHSKRRTFRALIHEAERRCRTLQRSQPASRLRETCGRLYGATGTDEKVDGDMKEHAKLLFAASMAVVGLALYRKSRRCKQPDFDRMFGGMGLDRYKYIEDYVDVKAEMVGGAKEDDKVPTVILFHSRNDSDPSPGKLFPNVKSPARVIMPISPLSIDGEPVWSTRRAVETEEGPKQKDAFYQEYSEHFSGFEQIPFVVQKMFPKAERQPVILTGYSQGAIMALGIGTSVGLPVVAANGTLEKNFYTGPSTIKNRIVMMNGTEDRTVPFAGAKKTSERLKGEGYDVKFIPVEGAGHAHAKLPWSRELEDMIKRCS